MAAIAALIGVSLAATASAGSTSPRLYAVAATEACLKSLPDAIAGLPPAVPPVPPVPFVFRFSRDRLPPPAEAQLGAWYGHRKMDAYDGVTLSFFKTVHDARSFNNSRGRFIRNVVVGWDDHHPPVVEASWRKAVRGCLRAEFTAGETPAPKRSTPQASLGTFAGYWGGHTRRLQISSGGRAVEDASEGCCHRSYHTTFQIFSVSGTLTRATATYRVTSFKRYESNMTRLHVGQVGKLLLRNGIVRNTLTQDAFCSDPAWGATGFCGA